MREKSKIKSLELATKVIHIGGEPDKETGAVTAPIYQTSTYVQKSPGKTKGYEYTRTHNPTRTRLEDCLASIEKGRYALATSSGLSANMLIMQVLPPGQTVICGDDVYGGTYRMFTKVFHQTHNFIFTDTTDLKNVQYLIKKHRPALLWLESPTNPLLKISDIEKLSGFAKKHNCLTVVDNTFMSPYFQNPLKLGADIVVHSLTKYINGHSDVVAGGLILNSKKLYDKLWFLQNSTGPTQSPFDSWLILRGLKTLAVRMKKHEENALEIAHFLNKHSKVENVIYPGLSSHPQHALAKRQTSGHGGMLTFYLKGGLRASRTFLSSLDIFSLAESLGGVESLIEHPAIMTHASVPKKIREKLGIQDNLIRVSVGIEDSKDLIKDLKNGLAKI
ncbi:MAG: PLP-dependent aspartate aminotransferase family protein [Bacteriovoracales bacterium]|nr:PLP-dependent aspartate aminotransferase family protein [Bacteriovoracales bacterium]